MTLLRANSIILTDPVRMGVLIDFAFTDPFAPHEVRCAADLNALIVVLFPKRLTGCFRDTLLAQHCKTLVPSESRDFGGEAVSDNKNWHRRILERPSILPGGLLRLETAGASGSACLNHYLRQRELWPSTLASLQRRMRPSVRASWPISRAAACGRIAVSS
jgi:hypothetical protein